MGCKAPQYRCERCKDTGRVMMCNIYHGVFADDYIYKPVTCPRCLGNPSSLYPKTPPSPPPPPKKEPASKVLLPATEWFYQRAMERSKEIKEVHRKSSDNDEQGAAMSIPKKVHIFESGDWSAIYFDGKLVHWHDTPSLSRLLHMMNIDCEWDELPSECPRDGDDEPQPPGTLAELENAVRSHKKRELQAEIERKKRELAELERQL